MRARTSGAPFPERNLLIFLTFAVIFATLVAQGLTLPKLIRRLGLAEEEWTRDCTLERMRALYEYRSRRFSARAGKIEDDAYEDRSLAYQQTVQAVLAAQRDALVQLRNEGVISNQAMGRVVKEIDIEESRLEI